MLSRKYRFPLKKEFASFKNKARLFQSPLFGLLVLQTKNKTPRFGFVISKKTEKKATKRNRLKRVFSEAVFKNLEKLKPGFDVVFLVKKTALGKDFRQICLEVENAFAKAGLFNNDSKDSFKNN